MSNPTKHIDSIDPFKHPSTEHTSPWASQQQIAFQSSDNNADLAQHESSYSQYGSAHDPYVHDVYQKDQAAAISVEQSSSSITGPFPSGSGTDGVSVSGSTSRRDRFDSSNSGGKEAKPKKKLQFSLKSITPKNSQIYTYRFDVSTNLPEYKRRKYYGIERGHLEFEKLAKHLAISYPLCLVLSFPALPNLSLHTTADNEPAVRTFVQTWLDWVSFHSILQNDYELRKFVEAPFIFNPTAVITSTSKSKFEIEYDKFARSSSGFFQGWSSSSRKTQGSKQTLVQKTNNGTTQQPPPLSTNEKFALMGAEFDIVTRPLGNAKTQLIELQRNIQQTGKSTLEVSSQLTGLGNIDLGKQYKLATSLLSLGRSEKAISAIQSLISSVEGTQPCYYLSNLGNSNTDIQRSLNNRKIVFSEYSEAKQSHDRKKQAVNILRSSSTIASKAVDETLKTMEEAKTIETELRQKAEQIDRVLTIDIKKFKVVRHGLLSQMLKTWATSQLALERQTLDEYKTALKLVQQSSAEGFSDHQRKLRIAALSNGRNSGSTATATTTANDSTRASADSDGAANRNISSGSSVHFSPKLGSSITPGISSIFSS